MPVQVLWGTDDPVLPAAQADQLPAAFAVRRLPRAGHMLIEETPQAVVEAIRSDLLQTVP
jgi:pyruvate dehydrogenase E2 component (dihydrolipoamide acetyltransferase)